MRGAEYEFKNLESELKNPESECKKLESDVKKIKWDFTIIECRGVALVINSRFYTLLQNMVVIISNQNIIIIMSIHSME